MSRHHDERLVAPAQELIVLRGKKRAVVIRITFAREHHESAAGPATMVAGPAALSWDACRYSIMEVEMLRPDAML